MCEQLLCVNSNTVFTVGLIREHTFLIASKELTLFMRPGKL